MPLAAAAVTVAAMVVVRNFHLLLSRCHLIRTYAHTHTHIHAYVPTMMNIYRNPITLHFFIQYHQFGHPIKSTSCESNGKYTCMYIKRICVTYITTNRITYANTHTSSNTYCQRETGSMLLFSCSLLFSLQIALVWCAHMFSIFVPYGNGFKSNKRFQVT